MQYLLRQWAFVNNMLWDPIEVFNCEGERIYSEMNTGSWWWEEQVFICIDTSAKTIFQLTWLIRLIWLISPISLVSPVIQTEGL